MNNMDMINPIEEIKCRDISMVVLPDGTHQFVATKCGISDEPHGCQYLLSIGDCPRGYGKKIDPSLVM